MSSLPFERFWRRLDPRTSIAARLVLGFFLAFLLPGAVFVLLTQRRLSSLQAASAEQVAAVRVAETEIRMAQDVAFRAEWIDRRARIAEEAAWTLADAAAGALLGPSPEEPTRLALDREGHLWTEIPEEESVAIVSTRAPDPEAARRDAIRLRSLAPLMARLRERRPSVHGVGIWTASGAVRLSPWLDFRRADHAAAADLERFVLHPDPGFPPSRPATGDEAIWVGLLEAPGEAAAGRKLATVFVPVRDAAGRIVAGVSLNVDPRRYVAEAFETSDPVGDFWLALDAPGRAITMTPRAAAALGWSGAGAGTLSEAASPELKRLALETLKAPRSAQAYVVDGQTLRITSARVAATGWVLLEGLSGEAVETIQAEALRAFPPASYSGLKRDLLLLFALLALAVLGAVGLVSRRISAPVGALVHAAEEVGRGRPVELSPEAPDEIGRLAAAIGSMSQRVTRRVETLRRLHAFSRSAYRMTDVKEVLGRSTQAIAAFTGAERVWFHLYDRNTNRLEAAQPSWNVSEEMAAKLKVSVDARSISGLVFRTGEAYCSNDLDRDPYANRDLQKIVGGRNVVVVPLKTEEETLGVAVAINRAGRLRPGGSRRGHLVRRPRLAPSAQCAALRHADRHRRRAAAREPPEGPLSAERQPRAAHASDRHRRLDGPLRGGRDRREDAAPRVAPDPAVGARPPGAHRRPPRSRPSRARGADHGLEARLALRSHRAVGRDRSAHGGIPGRRAHPRAAARADAAGARRRARVSSRSSGTCSPTRSISRRSTGAWSSGSSGNRSVTW